MFCLISLSDLLLFRIVLEPQTILQIMLRVANMLGGCFVKCK